MINQQLISIIVPCYNQAKYLDECLQSVLDQTYKNWECIIVNDGSTDDSEIIIQKWIETDNRFIYIYQENLGVSVARNNGINKANGEWILPLDGDDKIGEEYLKRAQEEFDKGYTIIYAKAVFFGKINKDWQLKDYKYSTMLVYNHIYCSAFYKKEKWRRIGGYDSNLIYGFEDWEFWINILDEKSKVLKLDYIGFYYRRKNVSRDVIINNCEEYKLKTYDYIYKKHLHKYLIYNKNPIENYKTIYDKLTEMNLNYNKINKNIITRILFKIIKIIS